MPKRTKMRKPTIGPEPSKQAVIYARVSSKEQEKEGFSLQSQLKSLYAHAESHDFEVVMEYVDVETAKQSGRNQFNAMITFLKINSSCRIILVEKTDRLYRNFKDYVTLNVEELGIEIHLVKENCILSRDSRSSEKLIHDIRVAMAKNYSDNLSEEARKGMLEKAEQGIWPTKAPLGYMNVLGPNGKRIIEKDSERAPIVEKMFEQYATGDYSMKEITKMARADGLCFKRTKHPITLGSVHLILRNRIYTGDFDWLDKTYSGIHEPVISKELWERVQEVIDARHAKRYHKIKHDFAFSRLITCGYCGCVLVGEKQKGKYVYYHCTGYKGNCPKPYNREEILERKFNELLKTIAIDPELVPIIQEALKLSHRDEKEYHNNAISKLQAENKKIQSRIDKMYEDRLDGRIDAKFFDTKATEFRQKQKQIARSIEHHGSANKNYFRETGILLELASHAHKLSKNQKKNADF